MINKTCQLSFKYFRFCLTPVGIHGNELVGRELILLLARHLCLGYIAHEEGVTHLVDNTRIFLIPLVNPDGAEIAVEGSCTSNIGKNNSAGIDLAMDFPGKLRILFFYSSFDIVKFSFLRSIFFK